MPSTLVQPPESTASEQQPHSTSEAISTHLRRFDPEWAVSLDEVVHQLLQVEARAAPLFVGSTERWQETIETSRSTETATSASVTIAGAVGSPNLVAAPLSSAVGTWVSVSAGASLQLHTADATDVLETWPTRGAERHLIFRSEIQSLVGFSPARGYQWQDRLQQLRRWRGDPTESEVYSLSEAALDVAENLAIYAEHRCSARQVRLPTILAPLANGGVHVEWTVRGPSVRHLEVGIPPVYDGRIELLQTKETLDGQILSAYEVAHVSMSELFVRLERLIIRAQRWETRVVA